MCSSVSMCMCLSMVVCMHLSTVVCMCPSVTVHVRAVARDVKPARSWGYRWL